MKTCGSQLGGVSVYREDIYLLVILILTLHLVRTVILALMGFFPTEARGAIGGLDYTKEERRAFAKQ